MWYCVINPTTGFINQKVLFGRRKFMRPTTFWTKINHTLVTVKEMNNKKFISKLIVEEEIIPQKTIMFALSNVQTRTM